MLLDRSTTERKKKTDKYDLPAGEDQFLTCIDTLSWLSIRPGEFYTCKVPKSQKDPSEWELSTVSLVELCKQLGIKQPWVLFKLHSKGDAKGDSQGLRIRKREAHEDPDVIIDASTPADKDAPVRENATTAGHLEVESDCLCLHAYSA